MPGSIFASQAADDATSAGRTTTTSGDGTLTEIYQTWATHDLDGNPFATPREEEDLGDDGECFASMVYHCLHLTGNPFATPRDTVTSAKSSSSQVQCYY